MRKLPGIIIGIFVIFLFLINPHYANAATIASQEQVWSDSLNVWQAMQELGSNLSGPAGSFTFRISTAVSNINQFDRTAGNSRIYDKEDNSFIYACSPKGGNPSDPLLGLKFTTDGVPAGFEDVTLDFSCRNFDFINGRRYLIIISNANMAGFGGKKIYFAVSLYGAGGQGGTDRFSEGGLRYAPDKGVCKPYHYIWNSSGTKSGCIIKTDSRDDLYFILTNTDPDPPPPKLPVIFIPGIGGSEMKANQDIFWSKDDGHGGVYSHAYSGNEKIWVNQDKAAELGNDDYFDVLRLKSDGVTAEADLSLTGNLTPFGYPDIDSFFTDMGYTKGVNFFIFPYDWRKDVRSTKDSLDNLIESAKTASGQSKINLVVHSMRGLVARYYISDAAKAVKVNKLIELGVPHLGAVDALKNLMSGVALEKNVFGFIPLGIPKSEIHDIYQTLTSGFQLLPSKSYFNFYDHMFKDDRDIDKNNVTGTLNFEQTKLLLSNLDYNMTTFGMGEDFHNLDSILNQTNGVIVYEITGTAQPTLGQIHETWWITWPINFINKTDEVYINGDGTVPLYSASLKNDSLDLSGASRIYYVEQKHGDLVSSTGPAMMVVKGILNDDNAAIPVEVKEQKIDLEGEQLSLDDGELDLYDEQNRHCGLNNNGEIEENIPDVTCTTSENTKHAFIKKKAAKIKVKITRKKPSNTSKTTNLKSRTYRQDKISKTTIYKDINLTQAGKIEFDLDPATDTSPVLTLYPDSMKPDNTTIVTTAEISGAAASDQTPPVTSLQISGTKDASGIYTGPVTITLTGADNESGILRIEYSLDNGETIQIYTDPFTVSAPGKTIIQIKAVDKLGNEEIPQTITVEIAIPATPTPTPTPITSTTTSSNSSSTNISGVAPDSPEVNLNGQTKQTDPDAKPANILGVTFKNPNHVSDEINISNLLGTDKKTIIKTKPQSIIKVLGGLLIISGGIIAVASAGLLVTFLKPVPHKM